MPPKSAAAKGRSDEEHARDNPELFIKERFADATEKTPYTTLLCGLSEVTKAALQAAVVPVPGLDVKFFPANDALAIGWGKKDIWNGTSTGGGTPAKRRARASNASALPVKQSPAVKTVAKGGTVTGKTRGRPRKSEETPAKAAGSKRKAAAAEAHASSKRQKKTPAGSIVGSYEVKCPGIEQEWPSQCDNGLGLGISTTDQDGVYVGEFDFGVLEGVMFISTDKEAISRYSRQIDKENSYSRNKYGVGDDSEDDSEDEDTAPATGTAKSGKKGAKATAAAKTEAPPPLKYHLCWRGRETSEGEIQSDSWGEIKFTNSMFKKFTGLVSMNFAGSCKLTGSKTSTDDPLASPTRWAEYSEEQYEYERVRRWGGSRW